MEKILDLTIDDKLTIKINSEVGGVFEIDMKSTENMILQPTFQILERNTLKTELTQQNGIVKDETNYKYKFVLPKNLFVTNYDFRLYLKKPQGEIVSCLHGKLKVV